MAVMALNLAGPVKGRVERGWDDLKFRQAVLMIREDYWHHRMRLSTVVEKWTTWERLSDHLSQQDVLAAIFYRVEQSLLECDLPGGYGGFE